MKIDAYTFCWNEEVRLKYYLELYSPICRKITIFDNGSTDSSREIASKYNNVIWDNKTYGQNEIHDGILTSIKNNCWKNSSDADWVIVGDIDEILYHKDSLEKYLVDVKDEGKYKIIRAHGYDMVSEKIPMHEGAIYDKEEFRMGVKNNMYDKILIFSPSDVVNINYLPGAHEARPILKEGHPATSTLYNDQLKLLHYKYIGKEYFAQRNQTMGERLTEYNIKHSFGFQYLWSENKINQDYQKNYELRAKII